eukprot:superscaffoldBa00000052_g891
MKPCTCALDVIPTALFKSYVPIFSPQGRCHLPPPQEAYLDPEVLASYRPFSNLPFLSKVPEMVVSFELQDHLKYNNLFENFQLLIWVLGLDPQLTFDDHTGRKEKGDPLNSAIDKMTKKTRDLRRQLRKAVMDHISDSFLETNVPLLVLIEAAKSGNEKEVKEYAQVFREHANKLVEPIEAS